MRRLGCELLGEAAFEHLIRRNGAGAVAESFEHLQQLAQDALVAIREVDRSARARHGGGDVPRLLAQRRERAGSASGIGAKARARSIEPLVEGRAPVSEEAVEQVSTVQGERFFELAGRNGGAECTDVAPNGRRLECDLGESAARENIATHLAPDEKHRRVQRTAGVIVIKLRPEER